MKVGGGAGERGSAHSPDISLTSITLSPLVTSAEPESFSYACVYMKVCVHVSGGMGGGRCGLDDFFFYPFPLLVSQL